VDDKKYVVVNHGDCYHITLSVAAYPKKEENAKQIIKEVFK
jgi:RNA binding exosome subunit